jgi:hypothetical protein
MDNVGSDGWFDFVTIGMFLTHTMVKIKSKSPREIVIVLSSQ